jgi:hypothetical protein
VLRLYQKPFLVKVYMRFLPETPKNVKTKLIRKLEDTLQLNTPDRFTTRLPKIRMLRKKYYVLIYPDWHFMLSKERLKALLSEYLGKVDVLEVEFNPLSIKGTSFVIGSKEARRVVEC